MCGIGALALRGLKKLCIASAPGPAADLPAAGAAAAAVATDLPEAVAVRSAAAVAWTNKAVAEGAGATSLKSDPSWPRSDRAEAERLVNERSILRRARGAAVAACTLSDMLLVGRWRLNLGRAEFRWGEKANVRGIVGLLGTL